MFNVDIQELLAQSLLLSTNIYWATVLFQPLCCLYIFLIKQTSFFSSWSCHSSGRATTLFKKTSQSIFTNWCKYYRNYIFLTIIFKHISFSFPSIKSPVLVVSLCQSSTAALFIFPNSKVYSRFFLPWSDVKILSSWFQKFHVISLKWR